MKRGDTVLLPAGPKNTPHLWIVVTNPRPETREVVIVSVTTLRNAADQTIILKRGDHPFIRHQSSIRFGDCRIVDAAKIDTLVRDGKVESRDCCSTELIDEIEDGIWSSPFTPKKILKFLEEHA